MIEWELGTAVAQKQNGFCSPMVSDLEIYRTANLWLSQHGDVALVRARHRAAELQAIDDRDGADVWLRIIVAIETWGSDATSAHRPQEGI
jgi:hypothetical protein